MCTLSLYIKTLPSDLHTEHIKPFHLFLFSCNTIINMSQCVSNLSISHPLSSPLKTPSSNLNPLVFIVSRLRTPTVCINSNATIKAVNNGGDRLQQRATNKQPQLQQKQAPVQKRVAQVPSTGLWDRFPTARTVQQMMETMDGLIDDPFAYRGAAWVAPPPSESGGYSRGRTPWEIKEGEKEYKLRFDMPGMTREDVKVWVEEKMLVLKAEKLSKRNDNENENGKEGVKVDDEWDVKSYGKYSTRIGLPENVEFEKIKAEVRDGVLYIIVPKAASSAKILDISVN